MSARALVRRFHITSKESPVAYRQRKPVVGALFLLAVVFGSYLPPTMGAEDKAQSRRKNRALAVVLAKTAPVIDGKLDEQVWRQADFQTGFVYIHRGWPAAPDTSFTVIADRSHVYIGVFCPV